MIPRRSPTRNVPESEEHMPVLPPLDGDLGDDPVGANESDLPINEFEGEASLDDEAAGDESELPNDGEGDAEAGWLEGAEDSDDLDVGDLADEFDPETNATNAESWLGDEVDRRDENAQDVTDDGSLGDADEGADGPEGEIFDDIEEGLPLAIDDPDDDAAADPMAAEGDGLPDAGTPLAFALPTPRCASFIVLSTEGSVLAAAVSQGRALLCGDGVFAAALAAGEALDGRTRVARRVASTDEMISSVVSVGGHAFVAVSLRGRVLRSDDDGATWDVIATMGSDDAGKATVNLAAEATGEHVRLWARAHGGGLFRSDDGGRQWDGPVLDQPVRALAVDARRGGLLVASTQWASAVRRTLDGHTWTAVEVKLPGPPTLAACCGDVWAFGFARGAGVLSVDAGRTLVAWPLLAGVSALTLVETDDGAVQVVAAIHDEATDHATMIAAGIDRDGAARGARRIADLDEMLPVAAAGLDEEVESRVEALIPVDPAGRRILVVTPRGTVVVSRVES